MIHVRKWKRWMLWVCMLTVSLSTHADTPYGFYSGDYVTPTDTLNVRTGAGTGYAVIGTVQPGHAGRIVSGPTYNNGYYWWRINWPIQGFTGWSAQTYLTLYNDRDEENWSGSLVQVVGGISLNLRSGSGVTYGIVETIPEGTIAAVINGPVQNHGFVWWKLNVQPSNEQGWAVQRYLTNYTDTVRPVIDITGPTSITVDYGATYVDQGATATDNVNGDITDWVVTTGLPISTTKPGTYYVRYNVSDTAGNDAYEQARIVHVSEQVVSEDTTRPVITVIGDLAVTVDYGASYIDQGATAMDDVDGDITAYIVTGGLPVDTYTAGDHLVTYNVTDTAGNAAYETGRLVTVLEGSAPPPPEEGAAVIFGNTLNTSWYDHSWNASYTENEGHLTASFDDYGELRFNTSTFDTTGYNLLSFYVKPHNMNEQLYVHVYDEYGNMSWTYHLYIPNYSFGNQLYPYEWQEIHIPLVDLNADNRVITGVALQIDYAQTLDFDELRFNLRTDSDGGTCDEN